MEVRKGYVEHIVFRNNDNGYTVFQLVSEEEELTCVGLFSVLAEGELVQVSGYMKEHPLYGEQLQVEQYELLAPEDETAMERYLGSGAIKGIGAAMAARIVRRFKGEMCIRDREQGRMPIIRHCRWNPQRHWRSGFWICADICREKYSMRDRILRNHLCRAQKNM